MTDLTQQLTALAERYGAGTFSVEDIDDDDPVLRSASGDLVDTWREGYPYPERMGRAEYEHSLRLLDYDDEDDSVVGRPDPLIVGCAADLYEAGERGS